MWSGCAFAVYHLCGWFARSVTAAAYRCHSARTGGHSKVVVMTIPHNNVESVESAESGGAWGAPVPAGERHSSPWSTRRIIISAAVAVVIVAGGTAAVMAATNGSTTSGGNGGFPGGGFPGGGRFGGGAALAGALHGDFVVSNGSGGYTTERLQTGTVSSVSAGSLTVKSTDGYTQTYVVDSSTSVDQGADSISKVVGGNTVTVVAKLAGSTATAATVEDSTIDAGGAGNGRVGGGQGGFGGGPGGPGGN